MADVPKASSGVVGSVSLDCPELPEPFELPEPLELPDPLELFELLEPPLELLPDPPLPDELLPDELPEEPPPEELPVDELFPEFPLALPLPLELLPEPPEPVEEFCDADVELLAGAGARYITERTSSSIRRISARASWACSTSAWPADE